MSQNFGLTENYQCDDPELACLTDPKRAKRPYCILKLLGHGAFGDVYLAMTSIPIYNLDYYPNKPETPVLTSPVQLVAIKHFKETCNLQNVQNEIKTLNHVRRCKGVARAIDLVIGDRSVMLVMQYHPSVDFRAVCSNHAWTPAMAIKYVRSILTAVNEIHAAGVIHRDIKPDNFLFDPETGSGVLIDFGLAVTRPTPYTFTPGTDLQGVDLAPSDRGTAHGEKFRTAPGTAGFRAPEALLGQMRQTSWAGLDVWSVGVMLLMMLTNRTSIMRTRASMPIPVDESNLIAGEHAIELFMVRALVGDAAFRSGLSSMGCAIALPVKCDELPITTTIRDVLRAYSASSEAIPGLWDLCEGLLTVDPFERWSAVKALDSSVFQLSDEELAKFSSSRH
ncbi:Cell division cycle 7 Cdc7 [Carpediemonas membranifera]|uniref:non-specific serine/threonine protein kinase n=1 Tax=Carpediemonas membranifera TaxID=201153 RepID=A0A8J6B3C7_9EUKA|nr:Cell division cycle 7 Cdc7 [Carpediemonas membranifera]|eukprot:KAG9394848.1 Cell division cycle 7 Cdc7 [Carpediemonas membranifera]